MACYFQARVNCTKSLGGMLFIAWPQRNAVSWDGNFSPLKPSMCNKTACLQSPTWLPGHLRPIANHALRTAIIPSHSGVHCVHKEPRYDGVRSSNARGRLNCICVAGRQGVKAGFCRALPNAAPLPHRHYTSHPRSRIRPRNRFGNTHRLSHAFALHGHLPGHLHAAVLNRVAGQQLHARTQAAAHGHG